MWWHRIAVEDHLPPNKKHTLEEKLALGSLSVFSATVLSQKVPQVLLRITVEIR